MLGSLSTRSTPDCNHYTVIPFRSSNVGTRCVVHHGWWWLITCGWLHPTYCREYVGFKGGPFGRHLEWDYKTFIPQRIQVLPLESTHYYHGWCMVMYNPGSIYRRHSECHRDDNGMKCQIFTLRVPPNLRKGGQFHVSRLIPYYCVKKQGGKNKTIWIGLKDLSQGGFISINYLVWLKTQRPLYNLLILTLTEFSKIILHFVYSNKTLVTCRRPEYSSTLKLSFNKTD